MPSLKDLKDRIASVNSTRKITSAMKMVAAAKLRRAQEQAEAGRPYAERMRTLLANLAAGSHADLALLQGTGSEQTQLIVLATADRGLAGGFNTNLIREALRQARAHLEAGRQVKFYCLGRKGAVAVRRDYPDALIKVVEDLDKPRLGFDKASAIAQDLLSLFDAKAFDVATLIYAEFHSAISQEVTPLRLIPFRPDEAEDDSQADSGAAAILHDYEPNEADILADLLPRNIAVQIYRGLLENAASEQGARMTAMDNATRNAGDMVGQLTLLYNRTRQAQITKELIEIVSGAEAL